MLTSGAVLAFLAFAFSLVVAWRFRKMKIIAERLACEKERLSFERQFALNALEAANERGGHEPPPPRSESSFDGRPPNTAPTTSHSSATRAPDGAPPPVVECLVLQGPSSQEGLQGGALAEPPERDWLTLPRLLQWGRAGAPAPDAAPATLASSALPPTSLAHGAWPAAAKARAPSSYGTESELEAVTAKPRAGVRATLLPSPAAAL